MIKKIKQIIKKDVKKSFIRDFLENMNPVLKKFLEIVGLIVLLFSFFQFIQWFSGTLDISLDKNFHIGVNDTPALKFNLINHYRKDLHNIDSIATLTCGKNYTEVLSTQQLDSGYSIMMRGSDKDIITSQDDRYSSIVNIGGSCPDAYFTIAEYLDGGDGYHSFLNNITTYSFYKTGNDISIIATDYSKYDWITVKACIPCQIKLEVSSEEKNFSEKFDKEFFTDDITYTPFTEYVGASPTGKAYLGIAQANLDYGICKGKSSEECRIMLCNYINKRTDYNMNCDPGCIVEKFNYDPFKRDFVYSINSKTDVYTVTDPNGKNTTVYHTIDTYCLGL